MFPPGECDLTIVVNVAMCTLASIQAFANVGLSHGDIKPANLMLTVDSQLVILINFGSAVPIGQTINETSAHWGKDCPVTGSIRYDMTCLASVLFHLLHGATPNDDLASMLAELPEDNILVGDQMIRDCLLRFDEDLGDIWNEWLRKIRELSIDQVLLAYFDKIWPVISDMA